MRPAGEPECDPQGQGGHRIAEIVDGVGEEGDRAGRCDDRHLQDRRDCENEEGPFHREDAALRRGDRGVDEAVAMARMPVTAMLVTAILMTAILMTAMPVAAMLMVTMSMGRAAEAEPGGQSPQGGHRVLKDIS